MSSRAWETERLTFAVGFVVPTFARHDCIRNARGWVAASRSNTTYQVSALKANPKIRALRQDIDSKSFVLGRR